MRIYSKNVRIQGSQGSSVHILKWFYTKLSPNDKFSLNILDLRLRGNDEAFTFYCLPRAGGDPVLQAEFD